MTCMRDVVSFDFLNMIVITEQTLFHHYDPNNNQTVNGEKYNGGRGTNNFQIRKSACIF